MRGLKLKLYNGNAGPVAESARGTRRCVARAEASFQQAMSPRLSAVRSDAILTTGGL
jgi:hypothetical protein